MTDSRQASPGTRAVAFNALTAAMSQTAWLRLSDRERLSAAVADAVDPLARADEAARFWDVARDFPEPYRSLIAEVAGRPALPQEAAR